MNYSLLELPTPFLSDLQARFPMAQALLLNHFAGTWTMTKVSQASRKFAFLQQLCVDRHATQTCAAGVLAVPFDDSTVHNNSRLAVAVTIVSTLMLCEGCNACLFKLHQWQSIKGPKEGLAINGLFICGFHCCNWSPPIHSNSKLAPLQIANPTLLSCMESSELLSLGTADTFPLRFASTLPNGPGPATEPLCRHMDNGKRFTSFSEISFRGTALCGQACHADLRSWCSCGIL